MDSGVTRVRFPEGVAPKLYQAFKEAKAQQRSSTHAQGTKLEVGFGKDVVNKSDRKFTPRGAGHILMLAASKDGTSNGLGKGQDHDLVLKREDYGFRDKLSHSIRHSVGGLKKLVGYSKLIDNKSTLAKECEKEFGKGHRNHRKEHLSELKQQSSALIALLEAGKKQERDLFPQFSTEWKVRIAIPPLERKIVGANNDSKLALGQFIKALADNQEFLRQDPKLASHLAKVAGLLEQARGYDEFAKCREGNEVLVNCETAQPKFVEAIAKQSDNSPVDRNELVLAGMVHSADPELKQGLDSEDQALLHAIDDVRAEIKAESIDELDIRSPSV